MYIRNFKDLSASDVDIAGGKGASLGEMTQAGILIPPGFVVLSKAFDDFLEKTTIDVKISSILSKINFENIEEVEEASREIRSIIVNEIFPKDLEKFLKINYKKLDVKFVAVRSSATAEDGAENAWAGQLETYLNTKEKNLLENIKKCWASLFTSRAIFYRFEKGLQDKKISVAVIVQGMIQSEVSGVAFTVHPVTEDLSQMIIEAGYGLGEAIVGGMITPDSYVVGKETLQVIESNISNQERMLVGSAVDGIHWENVENEKIKSQKLDKHQIIELAGICKKIENHYSFACDIEWAHEGGVFYVTQSRPITTLSLSAKIKKSNKSQVYKQIMNRAMDLVACELWDIGERIGLPAITDGAIYFDPLFYYEQGKGISVFYNFTDPKQDTKFLVNHFNEKTEKLPILKEIFDKNCKKIRELVNKKKEGSTDEVFKLIKDVWPLISVSNILGDDREYVKGVNGNLVDKFMDIRKESDGVLHFGEELLVNKMEKIIPEQYKKLSRFLLFSEIKDMKSIDFKKIESRKNTYIFHKGKIFDNILLSEFAKNNNFKILTNRDEVDIDKIKNEINGTIAFRGKAQGLSKIVFKKEDMKKLNKGDILVTPMTTPDLLPAMKKASAFVTDEGGVTCHAAIIAREMAKPCIIGVKVATEVLHDGDLIEVDANNGTIKILKKIKI